MAHSIERCTPILVKKKYFPTLRILFTCGVTLILRAKGGGMLPHSEIHTCLKVYYSEEVKMGVVLLRREISELREIRKIGEPSFPCGVTLEKRERKKCMVGAPYHHLSLSLSLTDNGRPVRHLSRGRLSSMGKNPSPPV